MSVRKAVEGPVNAIRERLDRIAPVPGASFIDRMNRPFSEKRHPAGVFWGD